MNALVIPPEYTSELLDIIEGGIASLYKRDRAVSQELLDVLNKWIAQQIADNGD